MPRTKVTESVRTIGTGEVLTANMAVDPTNASNLSSGSVPLAQLGNVDTTGLQADIALLAFKTQANGSLARYNLVDQSVDAFEDASGVDASASTGETRNSTGNYYSGVGAGPTNSNGTESIVGANTVVTWLTSGTFVVPAGATAANTDWLVVGGGGSGGKTYGAGGGGAGGFRYVTAQSIGAATFTVTVGAGGAANSSTPTGHGNVGANSEVSGTGLTTITAAGGGYGTGSAAGTGGTGGSGGGGSWTSGPAGTGNSPSTSPAQGFNGGAGGPSNNVDTGGGGGGAGAVGETVTASSVPAAAGGAGIENNIDGNNYY